MLNKLVDVLDSLFVFMSSNLKQNFADYSDLETAQDDTSLVSKDGSLLSIVRMDGIRSLINTSNLYQSITDPLAKNLDTFFNKNGHMIQVFFTYDPTKSYEVVKNALKPSYNTAKRLSLEIDEILDERVKNISSMASYESCYFVLWTRPTSINESEKKEENKRKVSMRANQVSSTKYTQDVYAANGLLMNTHNSFVKRIVEMFLECNIAVELLDVKEAVRVVRKSVDDSFTDDEWEPSLPGDTIYPNVRHEKQKAKEWDIIWPKLSWQVTPRDAEVISDKLVKIGDKIYAPGYIDLLPKEITPFKNLFNKIGNYPWRISFSIEGDGISSVNMKGLFAGILAVASGNNKLLKKGVDNLKHMQNDLNETIVKIRIAFCTWGKVSEKDDIERHISELVRAIETWGGCLVSDVTGDPVAGFVSSATGFTYNNIATESAMPLNAATFLLPLDRPTSAWRQGSVLFLSTDMKLIPYQPGSTEQTTWINLIFAKPGSGKSVLMNLMNLALCLAPGISRLPRIGITDIGLSSSGLISLIQEALPDNQKHLAQYHRIRMTEDFCINPFDTQLGCRYPTSVEVSFLNNLISLLIKDPSREHVPEGMDGFIQAIIKDMYDKTSDLSPNPKRYTPGLFSHIDSKINEIKKLKNILIDNKTSWWEIVDILFSEKEYLLASIAQRQAVPILADAAASAQDDKIREAYDLKVSSTEETLVQYFLRSLNAVLNHYKILARPTVFDISEARVVSLDLDEVAKGGGASNDQQTGIMFMLSRYILGKDFKLDAETVNEIPFPTTIKPPSHIPVNLYKDYHTKRIEDTKDDFKRLCFDEFHRTASSPIFRKQIITDMREGRKWNLDVTLASQSLQDFDEQMKSFATAIFILDSGTEKDVTDLIETFGIQDESEKYFLSQGIVRGPKNGKPGTFMVKFKTNSGDYTQLLQAPIGATEFWALSTTSEDAVLRSKMYKIYRPGKARSLLAKHYPRGIKKEVENRKIKQSGSIGPNEDDNIYEQIIEEIARKEKYY
jgi:intracellular multiplication protein IcmB